MKTNHMYILLILISLFSCKPTQQKSEQPSCISEKVESLKSQPVQNPPAEVWKWESEGNIFYYFNAACCDQFSKLYNEKCEIVCAPDGGMTGRGDGKCPDFSSGISKTLIWKDERKYSK
ncbi:MAG: DUF6970 domain-containing protein [Aquaticitalea sp.]